MGASDQGNQSIVDLTISLQYAMSEVILNQTFCLSQLNAVTTTYIPHMKIYEWIIFKVI